MDTKQNQEIRQEVKTLLAYVRAISETIREMGDEGCPEGPLYASLMGRMSFDSFQRIIQIIVNTGLVQRRNHALIWVGPKLQEGGGK